MLVVVIAGDEVAARIVDAAPSVLENCAGIVHVSDVEAIRNEHS